MNLLRVAKSILVSWKDLFLVVIGVYLALWMEKEVEDWQHQAKANDYLHRLSSDLIQDDAQITRLIERLSQKQSILASGIQTISQPDFDFNDTSNHPLLFEITSATMNYHFFTPQDITFVSMRESGDFRLIQSEQTKNSLLSVHEYYRSLAELQQNYMQGLDDLLIPFWIKHVDLLRQEIPDPQPLATPYFLNMLLFALNETSNRLERLKKTQQISQQTAALLKENPNQ